VAERVVLEADGLTVRYGPSVALQPMSLRLCEGELLLVLGPNGAGKTSLLRALAGAVDARGGMVRLCGQDVSRASAQERLRKGLSLVPEGRGRLPGLSVRDNLLLAWHTANAARRGARTDAIDKVTSLFPILRQRMEQDCSTMSGGEMQMLAIARALVSNPEVLLLDEPSLGLAPMATARVYEALGALSKQGLTMIVVEQKAVPLAAARESTLVIRNGSAVFSDQRRPSRDELAALYLGGEAA
jgi:branched-chain amino acid transport system ATP-binding protein